MNRIKRWHVYAAVLGLAVCGPVLSLRAEKSSVKNYSVGSGGVKSSASGEQNGKQVKLPIKKWETGTVITKDPKTGAEVREQFEYPVFDYSGIHAMGDNSLCWEVCKDACDGYGVCHAVCWTQCASQGGEGDPRKP